MLQKFKLAAKAEGGVDKQESRESSMSESLLSPKREPTMVEADSGFMSPSVSASQGQISHTSSVASLSSVQDSIKQEPEEMESLRSSENIPVVDSQKSEALNLKTDTQDAVPSLPAADDSDSTVKVEVKTEDNVQASLRDLEVHKSPDSAETVRIEKREAQECASSLSQKHDTLQKPENSNIELKADTERCNTSKSDIDPDDECVDVESIASTSKDILEIDASKRGAENNLEKEATKTVASPEKVTSLSTEHEESSGNQKDSEAAEVLDTANRSLEDGEIVTDTSMEVEPSSEAVPSEARPCVDTDNVEQLNSSTSPQKVETSNMGPDEASVSTSEHFVSCSSEMNREQNQVEHGAAGAHQSAKEEPQAEADSSVRASNQKEVKETEDGELTASEADVSQESIRPVEQHESMEVDECKVEDTSGSDLVSSSSSQRGTGDNACSTSPRPSFTPSPAAVLAAKVGSASDRNKMDSDSVPGPSSSSSLVTAESELSSISHSNADSTWNTSNSSVTDSSSNVISSSSNGCTDYMGGNAGPSSSVRVSEMDQIDQTSSNEEPCSSSALPESDDMYISAMPRARDSMWYNNCSSSSNVHSNSGIPHTDSTAAPSSVLSTSPSSMSSLLASSSSFSPRSSLSTRPSSLSSFSSLNAASTSSQSASVNSSSQPTAPPAKKKVRYY